jgi:hypothetical protein
VNTLERSRLGPLPLLHGSALCLAACASRPEAPAPDPPVPGAVLVDHLIVEGATRGEIDERRFLHLWQVTFDGENAEAYWSHGGTRLCFQRRNEDQGLPCDQIFVTGEQGHVLVSNGRGATTCAYFLPGDRRVLFASTHGHADACPPKPDYSQGYVWMLHPEFDLWVRDLDSGALEPLTREWGYDAEATVSPVGDRIVFTSTRSGDPELYTCALDGSDVRRITHAEGYDGGAFFSRDGRRLVYRRTAFTPGSEEAEIAEFRSLMRENKVRPHQLELWTCDADGANQAQLSRLGGANFAPYFLPDDRRVIFASNSHEESARNFDLFVTWKDGEMAWLERVTGYSGFDAFPMFSPDGRYLAFASNRGAARPGETNIFVAEWRPD